MGLGRAGGGHSVAMTAAGLVSGPFRSFERAVRSRTNRWAAFVRDVGDAFAADEPLFCDCDDVPAAHV